MTCKQPISLFFYALTLLFFLFYSFLVYCNIVNIEGIVLFSLLICLCLFLGTYFYNKGKTAVQKEQAAARMWKVLFAFYLFQMAYMLFFASEFARDYVNLGDESYVDALRIQCEYGCNLVPFATIQKMLLIFEIPGYNNTIAILNLFGNFAAFMPLAFFLMLLKPQAQKLSYMFTRTSLLIITVEVVQFLTMTGTMDIDDYLLNETGVLCMFLFLRYTPIHHIFPKLLQKTTKST